MPDLMSATAAAEVLAVPKTTVVGWLRSGIVCAPTDDRGRYRLDENALHALRRVASLRAAGASLASIRRRFNEDGTLTVQPEPKPTANDGPALALLRDLLEAERARNTELAARLEALAAAAAGHQARAELLDQRVKLLEAPPAPPARPWWKVWG
jgi:DNA-binding transcriptional MerR regulator